MLSLILRYGLIAGIIVATPMVWMWTSIDPGEAPPESMLLGYTIMLVALTFVFVGVKKYRDTMRGGVVKFLPAFGVGLAISTVASLCYVAGWEICMAFSPFDFTAHWSHAMIEAAKARGATGADLEKAVADAHDFVVMYHKPWMRMPMTFIEMFPVGVLVSLICAAVLRNPRVLPAR